MFEMSTAFSDAFIHSFFSCLMQHGEEFLRQRKRFTRRDTADLFGTGESGKVSQNSLWQVK
jgi:hypothetical protein